MQVGRYRDRTTVQLDLHQAKQLRKTLHWSLHNIDDIPSGSGVHRHHFLPTPSYHQHSLKTFAQNFQIFHVWYAVKIIFVVAVETHIK